MEILYIPRDPRTKKVKFMNGKPSNIKIDDWDEFINTLNQLIEKSHRISIFSFVKTILIFPRLFMYTEMDTSISEFLRLKNEQFKSDKLEVCHPKYQQYRELKVKIYNKQ